MNKKKQYLTLFFCLFFIHSELKAETPNLQCSFTLFTGYRYDSFFYHIDTYENHELILNNGLSINDLHSTEAGLTLQLFIAKKLLCSFEGSYSVIQQGNFHEEVLTYSPFPYRAEINSGNAYHLNIQAAYLVPLSFCWSFGPELGFFSDRIKTNINNATLWDQPYPLLNGLKFHQTWKGFKAGGLLIRETSCTITQLKYFYLVPSVAADYILQNSTSLTEGFSDHRFGKTGSGYDIILSYDIKFCPCWLAGIKGSFQKMQVNKGESNPFIENTFTDIVKKISWKNAEVLLRLTYFF